MKSDFVTKIACVYCEAHTEHLNICHMQVVLEMVRNISLPGRKNLLVITFLRFYRVSASSMRTMLKGIALTQNT